MTAMLASGFKTLEYYVARAPSQGIKTTECRGDRSVLQNTYQVEMGR
jgi:hypothetical protein